MVQVQKVVHKTDINISLKISYSTHACLAQLAQLQTCKLVKVSGVSSNPAGGNFIYFIFFKDTSMLILYKNDRNVRFVLSTKTSNDVVLYKRFMHINEMGNGLGDLGLVQCIESDTLTRLFGRPPQQDYSSSIK